MQIDRRRYITGIGTGVAAGLAGCTGGTGGNGGNESSNDSNDGGNSDGSLTTVTHWSGFFDDPKAKAWVNWYKSEAKKEVKVNLQLSSFSYMDMRKKYLTGAKTGTPDIIEGVLSHVNEYAVAGLIDPITDRAEDLDYYDKFLQGGLDSVTWKGKLWALPMKGNGRTYFYRKDVFEEMGWEDGPAQKADEFLEQMSEITKSKDGMYGFHNTTKKGEVRAFQEWISHMYQHEDHVFELKDGKWTVTPSADTFGKVFKWFYADPYLNTDAANKEDRSTDWRANDVGYLNGKYACVPCGPWLLGMETEAKDPDEAKGVIKKTATAQLANAPGASDPAGTYLETEANMINANAKHKDKAWDALAVHASPESIKKIGKKDPSYLLPPPFSNVDSAIDSPDRKEIKTAFKKGKGLAFISWGKPRDSLYNEMQQVIYGKKDPFKAGKDLRSEYMEIAKEMNS